MNKEPALSSIIILMKSHHCHSPTSSLVFKSPEQDARALEHIGSQASHTRKVAFSLSLRCFEGPNSYTSRRAQVKHSPFEATRVKPSRQDYKFKREQASPSLTLSLFREKNGREECEKEKARLDCN